VIISLTVYVPTNLGEGRLNNEVCSPLPTSDMGSCDQCVVLCGMTQKCTIGDLIDAGAGGWGNGGGYRGHVIVLQNFRISVWHRRNHIVAVHVKNPFGL